MKFFRYFFFTILIGFSSFKFSAIEDYYQYEIESTSSNYGLTGILETPNARMMNEGGLQFTFSSSFPNEFTTITASPFAWLEASYRYTEIKNKKYSRDVSFSGNQTAKDKGFDFKVRLLKESDYLPSVAVGLIDVGGTGVFASEYFAFTKSFGNLDATTGIGWGNLGRGGDLHYNPFINLLGSNFKTRTSSDQGLGGEFNVDAFFSGPAAIFGGIEYYFKKYGLKFKLEYDPSNYDKNLNNPMEVESHLNYGFNYFYSKNLNLGVSFERGKELRFTFVFKGRFSEDTLKKPKPKNVVKLSKEQSRRARNNKEIFYRSLNKSLRDESIFIQAASYDESSVDVSVASSRFVKASLLAGRTARIVSSLADDEVDKINVHLMNGDFETSIISVDRRMFDKADLSNLSSPGELLLRTSLTSNSHKPLVEDADFMPTVNFPEINWNMSPALRHQIGGPEAFYLGQLWWKTDLNLKLSRRLTLFSSFGVDVYNNFDDLDNPSYSTAPHVRSDIQEYLKEGENNIQRMQLEYMFSPLRDTYLRLDLGLLEEMFGGVGGEILYRPFNKNYSVGFSAHRVKQRGYKQRFSFRDYETNTGHLGLYYDFPMGVSAQMLIGKYLAGDKGLTLDLSRRFNSGFTLGVFATKTDMPKEVFGEGAFDKGFYFSIPTQLFYTDYRTGVISFGLHPLTKDGGALLNQHNSLFSILGDTNKSSTIRDWQNLLD